jgi:endonuclease/exonuclease/phosphatase family metal-dependent hydrolase
VDEHPPRVRRAEQLLRVMTYNVRGCVGTDRKVFPARIARVIARLEPDVVALQEVDAGRSRSGGIDQAREIARALGMEFHFHPSLALDGERSGNAVLSRLPMRLVQTGRLPGLPGRPDLEPRGILWVAVQVDGVEVQIINTHLGLSSRERGEQVSTLLSGDWLGHPGACGPVVLCGELNLTPWSRPYRRLRRRLQDAQLGHPAHRPTRTWSSVYPLAHVDDVFVGGDVVVEDIEEPRTQLIRCSSDQLPVIVTLRVRAPERA